MNEVRQEMLTRLEESIEVLRAVAASNMEAMESAIRLVVRSFSTGGKVVLFGNGGSAADAQHIAGELVGKFLLERRALPAIALNVNTSVITALGNDYGYETVFSRQVEALVTSQDVVIGLSTSGNSQNVIRAVQAAADKRAGTIGFTGGDGGKLAKEVDVCLIVPSDSTPRIQEAHITIAHIMCEMVERELVESSRCSLRA